MDGHHIALCAEVQGNVQLPRTIIIREMVCKCLAVITETVDIAAVLDNNIILIRTNYKNIESELKS